MDLALYSRRERDLAKRHVTTARRGRREEDEVYLARLSWRDIERIRSQCSLPLILKGIATAEDASTACELGVDAVYVSNHGGRQLDHGRSAIDVLPEVADAVSGRAEIIVDGGFLRGSDIVKALARGAGCVGLGRLLAFAIAAAGRAGVVRMLELLEAELRICLGLLGVGAPRPARRVLSPPRGAGHARTRSQRLPPPRRGVLIPPAGVPPSDTVRIRGARACFAVTDSEFPNQGRVVRAFIQIFDLRILLGAAERQCRRPPTTVCANPRPARTPEEYPAMIRTGDQYRESLRDGREVYMDGVRVEDVTVHPMFKPLVDIRARIYDMQHEAATKAIMTVEQDGEINAIGNALPFTPGRLVGEAPGHRRRLRRRSAGSSPGWATRRSGRCGRSSTVVTCCRRSIPASRRT